MKYIWFSILLLLCTKCTVDEEVSPILTFDEPYEILFPYNVEHEWYLKKNLIKYFVDIALGSEYGSDLPISKKWKKPMKVYVDGQPLKAHIEELTRISDELNSYFTDGFEIKIVEERDEANYFIFIGSLRAYKSNYFVPQILDPLTAGYFYSVSNNKFEIESGHMFVDTEHTTLKLQRHVLREELTQSLGLGNDIPIYANSIFFSEWSDVTEYSNYDREIIRLLYHPRMYAGLSDYAVRTQLSLILGIDPE